MIRVFALMVAAMVTTATPAAAGQAPDFAPLADLIQKTKDVTAHPSGTAVAVVKDGKVIFEGYFGFADIQRQTPVTRDTVFYIASATKPFLALNTLLKEHDGLLSTHTSMQQMFPDIAFQDIKAGDLTARDLLVHTSGVENHPLVWATALSGVHDAQSRRRLVAASHPNEAGRGTFDYSNVGYNIVSVWLDERLGTRWQDQLNSTIFQPLGMQRTSAYMSHAEAKGWRVARPYSLGSAEPNQPLYLAKHDDTMQAAGGLVSTAPDLAKFLLAQLSTDIPVEGWGLPGTVIMRSQIPEATLEEDYLDFQRTGYAWGWYTGEYKGRNMLHHFGGFAGFHAHLSFMPGENIGLVVLNNEDFLGARLTNLIADYVYGVLLEQADAGLNASIRFEELQAQALKMRASVRKQREGLLERKWSLSQPHEAYPGTYSNALLGDITVTLNDGRGMVFHWGRLSATASAYEKTDHVRIEFVPGSGLALAFEIDGESVRSLSIDEMRFVKIR